VVGGVREGENNVRKGGVGGIVKKTTRESPPDSGLRVREKDNVEGGKGKIQKRGGERTKKPTVRRIWKTSRLYKHRWLYGVLKEKDEGRFPTGEPRPNASFRWLVRTRGGVAGGGKNGGWYRAQNCATRGKFRSTLKLGVGPKALTKLQEGGPKS